MLSGKRIILGVTGGIAAYKAVNLLRLFQKQGAEVRVTLTPSATRFVGVETFASLSRGPVPVKVFSDNHAQDWTQHIHWGEWADLLVIAPCTANTLGKIAHGLSDNMLTSTVLAARCPVMICPTMDGCMYTAPATRRNLSIIRDFGYHILEPEKGYLASGLEDVGRLPAEEDIAAAAARIIESNDPEITRVLAGRKVLITAGPTREHIDPVRYISNPSSGKMGFAMARAAQRLGAEVTLLHGPVNLKLPRGMTHLPFTSADDLFEKVKANADHDVVIMAAAVSDFTPAVVHDEKVKKDRADSSIELKRTNDILKWLGENKKDGQVLIGFAMETQDLITNARKKLQKKNADWIIANSLKEPGAGFGVDTNCVHLLGLESDDQFKGSKLDVANQVLAHIFS